MENITDGRIGLVLKGMRPEVAAARAGVSLSTLRRGLVGVGVDEYTAQRIELVLPDVRVARTAPREDA